MLARWSSLAVGLGLMLAPLVLGYGGAGAILHDVAAGTLVCVVALAAVEWPLARLVLLGPAGWLLSGGAASGGRATAAELGAGALLLAVALAPRGGLGSVPLLGRLARRGGAGARA